MKNMWPNYLPGPKHLTLGLHIHQTTCQLPEGSSSRVVAQPQRKFSVSVQERKVSKVSKEPTKHGNKIRTEPTQLNHYSLDEVNSWSSSLLQRWQRSSSERRGTRCWKRLYSGLASYLTFPHLATSLLLLLYSAWLLRKCRKMKEIVALVIDWA